LDKLKHLGQTVILKLNLVKIGEIKLHENTYAKHGQLNLAKLQRVLCNFSPVSSAIATVVSLRTVTTGAVGATAARIPRILSYLPQKSS